MARTARMSISTTQQVWKFGFCCCLTVPPGGYSGRDSRLRPAHRQHLAKFALAEEFTITARRLRDAVRIEHEPVAVREIPHGRGCIGCVRKKAQHHAALVERVHASNSAHQQRRWMAGGCIGERSSSRVNQRECSGHVCQFKPPAQARFIGVKTSPGSVISPSWTARAILTIDATIAAGTPCRVICDEHIKLTGRCDDEVVEIASDLCHRVVMAAINSPDRRRTLRQDRTLDLPGRSALSRPRSRVALSGTGEL